MTIASRDNIFIQWWALCTFFCASLLGRQITNFWKKLLKFIWILSEWIENTPPILWNLDNFPPDKFYSTLLLTCLEKVSTQKSNNNITFNITYQPVFCNARKIWKEMRVILAPSDRNKKVLPDVPFIRFKNKKKLRDYLVRLQWPDTEVQAILEEIFLLFISVRVWKTGAYSKVNSLMWYTKLTTIIIVI